LGSSVCVAVIRVDAQVEVRITGTDGTSKKTMVTIPRNGAHASGAI
jgi:hypothetical protein